MAVVIGAGSYGEVTIRNGIAVKKFNKLSHLIQEFTALQYLRNCPHIVRVKGTDFYHLELHMELYDCSLRKWLEEAREKGKASREDIMNILRDVLIGLVEMHDRGLAHGDLKPGNILIRSKHKTTGAPIKPSAVLGDCGFVSLAKYAKVERTAPSYRDPIIAHDFGHDIFSFGICFLEMIGEVKINRQASYEELRKVIKDEVSESEYRDIILNLVHEDRDKRPTSRELLDMLFAMEIPHWRSPENSNNSKLLNYISSNERETIRSSMKEAVTRFEINRGKKGFVALLTFLAQKGVEKKYYLVHTGATLMILSAMFGKSGFKENDVNDICPKNYSTNTICKILETLLSSDIFLDILLVP